MYDLIIIGGGPGGLTAGIYAQRAMLNTLLLEKIGLGGQITMSDAIENYPGFTTIGGIELMKKFEEQARGLGLDIKFSEVIRLTDMGDHKEVETTEGVLEAKSVIISTGAKSKRLGVPGESEYIGRGVSFCATCDGFFFRDRVVAVLGGGNSALKEALYLAKIAKKVHLIHRREHFTAEKLTQEKVIADPKIDLHKHQIITEVKGDVMGVSGLGMKDNRTGEMSELAVDGVFIYVGITPNTDFVEVDKSPQGFVKTDARLHTSMKGVFAIGDCRESHLRQVATAVGDGALAAIMAEHYVESVK